MKKTLQELFFKYTELELKQSSFSSSSEEKIAKVSLAMVFGQSKEEIEIPPCFEKDIEDLFKE